MENDRSFRAAFEEHETSGGNRAVRVNRVSAKGKEVRNKRARA